MVFWLVLKLEISYNRVMISRRILFSFRVLFLKILLSFRVFFLED
jgi:hypothetical protein